MFYNAAVQIGRITIPACSSVCLSIRPSLCQSVLKMLRNICTNVLYIFFIVTVQSCIFILQVVQIGLLKRRLHPAQHAQRTQRKRRNASDAADATIAPAFWPLSIYLAFRSLRLLRTVLRALCALRWMKNPLKFESSKSHDTQWRI